MHLVVTNDNLLKQNIMIRNLLLFIFLLTSGFAFSQDISLSKDSTTLIELDELDEDEKLEIIESEF